MSNLTPVFALLSFALLIWSAGAGLSTYLSKEMSRAHDHGSMATGAQTAGDPHAVDPSAATGGGEALAKLREEAKAKPNDVEKQLSLADSLLRYAFPAGDSAVIMEAIGVFHQVLKIENERPEALLGLATVCLQTGIIDKAIEYYERYLKQRPDDYRAKTDFALAKVRAGEVAIGKEMLEKIVAEHKEFFPAQMTLAFALSAEGKLAEAETQARAARLLLKGDAEMEGRVDEFIRGLKEAPEARGLPAKEQAHDHEGQGHAHENNNVSPAAKLSEYFKTHAIVGPKIARTAWTSPSEYRLDLNDFPVAQMPPFAKEKFVSNVKAVLQTLPDKITVKIHDAGSGELLMEISA